MDFTPARALGRGRDRLQTGLESASGLERDCPRLVLLPQGRGAWNWPQPPAPFCPGESEPELPPSLTFSGRRVAVAGLIPPPHSGGGLAVTGLFPLCLLLPWKELGAVAWSLTLRGSWSGPGAIRALGGHWLGAVFGAHSSAGTGWVVGVPPRPVTPTSWNRCLCELESAGKFPSRGAALSWRLVQAVSLLSGFFPSVQRACGSCTSSDSCRLLGGIFVHGA